ncbi:MAG: hypothetical protein WBX15_11135 [Thermoanaerobaculia bacterium]
MSSPRSRSVLLASVLMLFVSAYPSPGTAAGAQEQTLPCPPESHPVPSPAPAPPPAPADQRPPQPCTPTPPAESNSPTPAAGAQPSALPPPSEPAQLEGTPTAAPEAPQTSPASPPPAADDTLAPVREEKDQFPNLNLYLPEGEVNLRVQKLIKNVLFESQVNYKFVDGSISTFLRYKYYARNFTYKIGVFDTIDFPSIERGSRNFDRVRGGLLLFELPRDFNNRYYLLIQLDGLSFGDVDNPDNNKSNLYTKLGYQYGTPFDERLNGIAGETRGRITPVLTAYRDIGPQKLGLAVGITEGLNSVGGDYHYTKLEVEGLKRFDFRPLSSFLVSRLHFGTMLQKDRVLHPPPTGDGTTTPMLEFSDFSVPRYEDFKLGGREAMKGVNDRFRGSDEVHLSDEYFVPLFRDVDHRFLGAHWNDLYGILYNGVGTVGFTRSPLRPTRDSEFGKIVVDGGVGFEAGLTIRDYQVLLSAVYARTITAPLAFQGDQFRLSVRTVH